jgi:hypothetical protein
MSDDFDYVRSRIPTYLGYGDEDARHDSDKRVRAIVGEALSDAQVRLGPALDAASTESLQAVMLQCSFTDQKFIHKFEHGPLDDATIAGLVAADRELVELEERVMNASTVPELNDLVARIHEQFERRRQPTLTSSQPPA